jgi:hypothetical protein
MLLKSRPQSPCRSCRQGLIADHDSQRLRMPREVISAAKSSTPRLYLLIAAGLKGQRCKLPIVPESTQESRCSLTPDSEKRPGYSRAHLHWCNAAFRLQCSIPAPPTYLKKHTNNLALTLFLFCDAHSVNDLA